MNWIHSRSHIFTTPLQKTFYAGWYVLNQSFHCVRDSHLRTSSAERLQPSCFACDGFELLILRCAWNTIGFRTGYCPVSTNRKINLLQYFLTSESNLILEIGGQLARLKSNRKLGEYLERTNRIETIMAKQDIIARVLHN